MIDAFRILANPHKRCAMTRLLGVAVQTVSNCSMVERRPQTLTHNVVASPIWNRFHSIKRHRALSGTQATRQWVRNHNTAYYSCSTLSAQQNGLDSEDFMRLPISQSTKRCSKCQCWPPLRCSSTLSCLKILDTITCSCLYCLPEISVVTKANYSVSHCCSIICLL